MDELIKSIREYAPYSSIKIYACLEIIANELVSLRNALPLSEEDMEKIQEAIELIEKVRPQFAIERIQISFIDEKPALTLLDTNKAHSLHENFKFIRPYGYKYRRGPLIRVSTFKELYISVVELFYKKNPLIIRGFIDKSKMNGQKRAYFSNSPVFLVKPYRIDNNLFIETKFSANGIRDMLLKLFREFNEDHLTFKIYFREKKEVNRRR